MARIWLFFTSWFLDFNSLEPGTSCFMFTALLPSHEICWRLHPFGNRWHLRGREGASSQTNAAKFRWKRQILWSCILQQKCCTGSCKHVTTGQQHWRCQNLTMKMHHYEVWPGNTMWKQADLLWEANNSLSNFLVFCCQLSLMCPALGKCPQGSEAAAAQHVARTPWACPWLAALLCHVGQAVPWPRTSAKRMLTRLKLW